MAEEKSPLPLGLTLRKTPSLLDLVSRLIPPTVSRASSPPPPVPDKVKASNVAAASIEIGSWKRSAVNEGEIVAKCYYAKRKLVWEILEMGLKHKMEIQWADVIGLHASIPDNGDAALIVRVSKPPLFYTENDPQPRKHTAWQSSKDFTGSQASICREHTLRFAYGALNKHFDRLINFDERLRSISTLETFTPSDMNQGRYAEALPFQEQDQIMQDQSMINCWDVDEQQASWSHVPLVSPVSVMNLPCIDENEAVTTMDTSSYWSDYDYTTSASALSDFLIEDHVAAASLNLNPPQHQNPVRAWLGDAEFENFRSSAVDHQHHRHQLEAFSTGTTAAAPPGSLPPEEVSAISRKLSAGDLLVNLPRVASMPQFFNVS